MKEKALRSFSAYSLVFSILLPFTVPIAFLLMILQMWIFGDKVETVVFIDMLLFELVLYLILLLIAYPVLIFPHVMDRKIGTEKWKKQRVYWGIGFSLFLCLFLPISLYIFVFLTFLILTDYFLMRKLPKIIQVVSFFVPFILMMSVALLIHYTL